MRASKVGGLYGRGDVGEEAVPSRQGGAILINEGPAIVAVDSHRCVALFRRPVAQGTGTFRRSHDRSGDRSKATSRELRLDGRLPDCSVVKDPAAAPLRRSAGLPFPAGPFLHTFVPGLPSWIAAQGSSAGVWRRPAGSGQPSAGTGQSLADSGQSIAGSGEPLADSGQPPAGTGQTLFETGETVADTGRSTHDARFRRGIGGREAANDHRDGDAAG